MNASEIPKTRICSTCLVEKPLDTDNFHAAKGYRFGFTGQCKVCRYTKIKEWRQTPDGKASIATASSKYGKTEKGKIFQKKSRTRHREKRRLNCIRWHSENQEHERKYNIENKMRKNFGLEPEEYQAMFDAQGGLCAICRRSETAVDQKGRIRKLAVDHAHANNKLRDLLCMNCNQGIGKFKENIQFLQAAIQYLEEWRAKHESQEAEMSCV
jgi:recombination endonuclease VII